LNKYLIVDIPKELFLELPNVNRTMEQLTDTLAFVNCHQQSSNPIMRHKLVGQLQQEDQDFA
jgi:hypothetical protein